MSTKKINNIEEGIPEDKEYLNEDTSVRQRNGINKQQSHRLSLTSQKYDVDGDGVLDNAEQTMRDLDTSDRGYLTNDKVYKIVQEQMKIQHKFYSMKRISIVLVCFTVILALSNLATAWVAAVLAKDTQAKDDMLYNKDGSKIMGTKAVSDKYEIETIDDSQSRLLATGRLGINMRMKKDHVVAIMDDSSFSVIKRTISKNPTVRHTFNVGVPYDKSQNGDVYTFHTQSGASIIADCKTDSLIGSRCPVEIICPTSKPGGDDCTGYAGLDCTYSASIQPPNCYDESDVCYTPEPVSLTYECVDNGSGFKWQSSQQPTCAEGEGCALAAPAEKETECPVTIVPDSDCSGYVADMECQFNWEEPTTCEDTDGVCSIERSGFYVDRCTCSSDSWSCEAALQEPCENEGCKLATTQEAETKCPTTIEPGSDCSAYVTDMDCQVDWVEPSTCEGTDGVCFERPGFYMNDCTCSFNDVENVSTWSCTELAVLQCQNEGCTLPSLEYAMDSPPTTPELPPGGGQQGATLNCAVNASAYGEIYNCEAVVSENTCFPTCNEGEECYECSTTTSTPSTTNYCVYNDKSGYVFDGQAFCNYDNVGCNNSTEDCPAIDVPSDTNSSNIISVSSVGCGSYNEQYYCQIAY